MIFRLLKECHRLRNFRDEPTTHSWTDSVGGTQQRKDSRQPTILDDDEYVEANRDGRSRTSRPGGGDPADDVLRGEWTDARGSVSGGD